MLFYKIHTSLETLPIYQWDKVQQTNDLSWLLYNRKPINKYLERDLTRVYASLVQNYSTGKNRVLEAKKRVVSLLIELVIDIAKNSKDTEKLKKASKVLRALMIDSTHEKLLWNIDFTETPGQRGLLTQIAIEIKKYNTQVQKVKDMPKQDIYNQLANLEAVLGVSIDIYTCPVVQWQAYVKTANTKININSKNVN